MNISKVYKDTINIIALFLGLVFLLSGISKVLYFNNFNMIVSTYKLLPFKIIPILSIILINIELTISIMLFTQHYQKFASLICAYLLIFFINIALISLLRGIKTKCGCLMFF